MQTRFTASLRIKTLLFAAFQFMGIYASAQKLEAIVFMSETCPICKSITAELRSIDAYYPDSILSLRAIFTTRNSLNEAVLKQFARKYKIGFSIEHDSLLYAARQYQATVNPEVILVERATTRIIYRGMIDDSFASVGKRRTVVKNQYLRMAIASWSKGETPQISETQPVGCLIQYP